MGGHVTRRPIVITLVVALAVTAAIVITVMVNSRSPSRATTIAASDHGFAQALIGFVSTSVHEQTPARVHVSISKVDRDWAYGSWTATFHDNGTYTKTFFVAEEYVGGTYRHFGKGYVTPSCPRQMPTAVCVGGFETRTVVVK